MVTLSGVTIVSPSQRSTTRRCLLTTTTKDGRAGGAGREPLVGSGLMGEPLEPRRGTSSRALP